MTDRRYINWWLACAESGLLEGRDYQVMFYGGALLSNVAATDEPSDEDIGEFVQLLSLGRRLIVVMDSDSNSNSREDRTNDVMARGPAAPDERTPASKAGVAPRSRGHAGSPFNVHATQPTSARLAAASER